MTWSLLMFWGIPGFWWWKRGPFGAYYRGKGGILGCSCSIKGSYFVEIGGLWQSWYREMLIWRGFAAPLFWFCGVSGRPFSGNFGFRFLRFFDITIFLLHTCAKLVVVFLGLVMARRYYHAIWQFWRLVLKLYRFSEGVSDVCCIRFRFLGGWFLVSV